MHYVHAARFGPVPGTVPGHANGTDRGDFRQLLPLLRLLGRLRPVHVSAGCVPVFRRRCFRCVQRRRRLLPVAVPACQRDLRGIRHRTWDARYGYFPTDH